MECAAGAGVEGGKDGSYCLTNTETEIMKTFYRSVVVMVHNTVRVLNTTELYSLKWLKQSILCIFYHFKEKLKEM